MAKNIIVSCDGTWQTDDQEVRTNVAILDRAIAKTGAGGRTQLRHHIDGVGTRRYWRGINWFMKRLDGAMGRGLGDAIKEGYDFVCRNYDPGDHIYLLGFSRGAYTARSLAGLIGVAGVFRDADEDDVENAYDFYRIAPKDRLDLSETNLPVDRRVEAPVEMVGVWDTVGSLGIPVLEPDHFLNRRHSFHDVTLGAHIRNAFHAIAVDEFRSTFKATLWRKNPNADQRSEQWWFPGGHGDVGGGWAEAGASAHALHWMADRARSCGVGLEDDKLPTAPGVGAPVNGGQIHINKDIGIAGGSIFYRDVFFPRTPKQTLSKTVVLRALQDPAYRPDNIDPDKVGGIPDVPRDLAKNFKAIMRDVYVGGSQTPRP